VRPAGRAESPSPKQPQARTTAAAANTAPTRTRMITSIYTARAEVVPSCPGRGGGLPVDHPLATNRNPRSCHGSAPGTPIVESQTGSLSSSASGGAYAPACPQTSPVTSRVRD